MCYDKRSYVSADKAETDRRKELEAKRTEVVDTLLRKADKAPQKATSDAMPVKEAAPAK